MTTDYYCYTIHRSVGTRKYMYPFVRTFTDFSPGTCYPFQRTFFDLRVFNSYTLSNLPPATTATMREKHHQRITEVEQAFFVPDICDVMY